MHESEEGMLNTAESLQNTDNGARMRAHLSEVSLQALLRTYVQKTLLRWNQAVGCEGPVSSHFQSRKRNMICTISKW